MITCLIKFASLKEAERWFLIEKSEQRANDTWPSRLKPVPETIEKGVQWSFSGFCLPCNHLFLPEFPQLREETRLGLQGLQSQNSRKEISSFTRIMPKTAHLQIQLLSWKPR